MRWVWLAVGGLALIGASVAGLAIGSVSVPLSETFAALFGQPVDPVHDLLIGTFRAPRVALGAVIGASLALSGAALQGLLRNPLADPYVLGVSSGGALGAAIALVTALAPVAIAAFAGALAALGLVYAVGRGRGSLSSDGLILAGVAVGLTMAAGLALVLFQAQSQAGDIVLWLMGRLGEATWSAVAWAGGCLVVGAVILAACARALDVLAQGDEAATTLGVDVGRITWAVVLATSVLVAGGVAFAGLIGFIGLIVPHVARYAVGPAHRWLLPVSALFGAAGLVLADVGARTVLKTGELPVGVVTGALGGPFFLVLLRRHLARA